MTISSFFRMTCFQFFPTERSGHLFVVLCASKSHLINYSWVTKPKRCKIFHFFFHFAWHLEGGIATILFWMSQRTIPLKISRHENQGNWPKFFRKRTPGANIPESPYDIILHCFFLIWTYLSEKKTDTHVLRIPPIIPTLLPTPRKHPNSAKLTTEAWKCSINHHNPNSAKLTTEAWKCSFNHHKTSKLSKTDDRSMKMLI